MQFEREIEERFSGERLRAMMLNSDSSDKICAEAAERAAEMFSEDRLTKNGSVGLDLDAFDVAVEVRLQTSHCF